MDQGLKTYLHNADIATQALLEALCRQPSVAAQRSGISEMADLVEKNLKKIGFRTRQLRVPDAPPAVYGEMVGRSPFTLLLYNHYDVQPAEPLELWKSPPFEPTVRDGKLYARGASDNKGEIAARLAAIQALLAVNGELPINIRWIIEGEEEIGSPHFAAIAEQYADLLQADGCLWEGSGFNQHDQAEIILGTKGMLYVEYSVQTLARDAHSGMAPILPSAAWRLHEALGTLRDQHGNVHIPGFYDNVLPPSPAQLKALEEQPDKDEIFREDYQVSQFVNNVSGLALRQQQNFSPTCNIAGLVSGYTGEGIKTVLPSKAKAKMDFRLVPDQDPDVIFASLRAFLDTEGFTDVLVEKLGSAEPVVTPLEHPFVQRLINISESYSGKPVEITPIIGGTLPLLGGLRRFVGVPGLSAPGNAGYWASGAHAPNEHIRLSDLTRAVSFNCYMFEELGKEWS